MQNAANRFALAFALAALSALPGHAVNEPNATNAAHPPQAPSSQAHPAKGVSKDPFDGVTYTPEQKAAIARIHQQTMANRDIIVNDKKLSEEQKSAMLQGYARLEYVAIFKVLTPQQQKQVRENMHPVRPAVQRDRPQTHSFHPALPR